MSRNFVLLIALVLGLVSCSTTKKSESVDVSLLNGQWNITEINGKSTAYDEVLPFVDLNIADKSISGNAGCNVMNGTFDINADNKEITFGNIATTRMMCPYMDTENSVLDALRNVKTFDIASTENTTDSVMLVNADGIVVLKLMKRSELDGHWNIAELNDSVVTTTDKVPFLDFRSNIKKVFGNLGCNSYNSSIELDTNNKTVKFGMGAMTQMMCPDADIERNITDVLPNVTSYKVVEDTVSLFDNSGKSLLKLVR